MNDEKRYRECVAEITDVLQRYDMAGAITVVHKQGSMFKYMFPSWSCIRFEGSQLRFRAHHSEYPSQEAQRQAVELSTHIVLQIRDIAAQTFGMFDNVAKMLEEKFDIEHRPFHDFDPEREQ